MQRTICSSDSRSRSRSSPSVGFHQCFMMGPRRPSFENPMRKRQMSYSRSVDDLSHKEHPSIVNISQVSFSNGSGTVQRVSFGEALNAKKSIRKSKRTIPASLLFGVGVAALFLGVCSFVVYLRYESLQDPWECTVIDAESHPDTDDFWTNFETIGSAWDFFRISGNRPGGKCVEFNTDYKSRRNQSMRVFFSDSDVRSYFSDFGLDRSRHKGAITLLWVPTLFNETSLADQIRCSDDGVWNFPNTKEAHEHFKLTKNKWKKNEQLEFTVSRSKWYLGFPKENALRTFILKKIQSRELPWKCERFRMKSCQTMSVWTHDGWNSDDEAHSLTRSYIPRKNLSGVSEIPRALIGKVVHYLAVRPQYQPEVLQMYKDGILYNELPVGGRLGSGISAHAYRATMPGTGEAVVFKSTLIGDEILTEARIMRELVGCPNVLELRGVVLGGKEHNGIIVPRVRKSFEKWTSTNPDLATSARFLAGIAEGMACISSRGVVHNDLTGRNILIDESHGYPRPVIIDFSLSLHPDEKLGPVTPTQHCEVDPDSIPRDGGKVAIKKSELTDVYAFGSLVHQILVPGYSSLGVWYAELESKRNVKFTVPPILGGGYGGVTHGVREDIDSLAALQSLMCNCYAPRFIRPSFQTVHSALLKIANKNKFRLF